MSEDDPARVAQRAAAVARIALIVACMAIALAVFGLFLPIRIG